MWHRLTPSSLTPCSLLARSSCQAQSRPGLSFSGLEHGLPVTPPGKGLGAPECRSPSSGGGGVCWVGGVLAGQACSLADALGQGGLAAEARALLRAALLPSSSRLLEADALQEGWVLGPLPSRFLGAGGGNGL